MAVGHVYIIQVTSGVTGGEMTQDFAYQVINEPGDANAAQLREHFVENVLDAIADIVSNVTPFTRFVTRNLFVPTDWDETLPSSPIMGTRAGQALPFFNAAAFKSAKPTAQQQPARKRFGYLSESDVQGQGLQDVLGYFAKLSTCAAWLGTTLTDTEGNQYQPVIVKRIRYTTESGKPAYRYPEGLFESVTYPAIGWNWQNGVTSQITRKLGRGI